MIMNIRLNILSGLVVALLVGPGSAVQAARLTEAPLVDAAWLAQHLESDDLVIVDLRDPVDGVSAYDAGHVPGAVSAPYVGYEWRETVGGVPGMLPPVENIAARIGALGIDGDSHVVLLSDGVDSSEFGKATRVYWTLKVLGHDAVSILDGGFRAWVAAGEPVTEVASSRPAADFVADFQPQLLASADQVRAAIDSPTELVDGRPVAQYRGLQKTNAVLALGTVPGSVNIPHSEVYDGISFADSALINRLSSAVGVESGEPTITFCNTGHWASIAWFALSEVAGHPDTAMYDGSMADWTRDAANPVIVLN